MAIDENLSPIYPARYTQYTMMRHRTKPICLIVEPERGMRDLLDDVLSVSDVEVTAIANDADALKLLKSSEGEKFNVVVCQAPPPGAKHSLVGKIRALKNSALLPVVCLSPSNGLQDRAQAFEQGGTDYLVRPVSPVTLAERVTFWSAREHRPF